MTPNEAKYLFLVLYDKFFEYGAPSYDDKQISIIFTKAQVRVFNNLYESLKGGFESSENVRRSLDNLIKSYTSTAFTTGVHPNGEFVNLPTDFQYAVEESVKFTAGGPEVLVKPITYDFYQANIKNKYKKPDSSVVWRMDIGRASESDPKRIELITDGNALYSYRLSYLTSFPDVVVDEFTPSNQVNFSLDPNVHQNIVDEAVKIAVASVMPEQYQIAHNEQKENE